MIRINLLAVEREQKKRPSLLATQKVAIAGSAILAAAALFLGWRFVSLRQESARVDAEIKAAQLETQRLRTVLQDVQNFEARKQQLQQRVALIEELRKGQSGPVRMLDEISRALPDRLWLTTLTQDTTGVKLDGRTTSLTALSDFVGNLENSGYFARPVEIIDSQVESAQGTGDVVRFSVKAQFQLPGAPAGTTPPAAAPAATPRPAAAATPAR
ncbi:MAG: PilN domain-containing protein [Acidobacteria bacterium]|jgi:type IV pilus assembly protein PilN|nr:PilN domain-containing protein [Acidobacteriota bacterium]